MKLTGTNRWLLGALLTAGLAGAVPNEGAAQFAPPAQQSPLAQSRKEVADARMEVSKSKVAMERARVKVEATFAKENPGYAAAQKAYEKALLDVKNMTATALAGLNKNPEYIDALKAKQAAKDKYAAAQADSKSSSDDLQADFNEVFARTKAVSEMEATVTQNDPRIVDAKQRLTDARQNLDDFKSKIDAACATDPEFQQSQQAETGAEQHLAEAEASMVQQQKALAAAAAAAAEAKSRTNAPPAPAAR
jgi:chromosome segregation ATPase